MLTGTPEDVILGKDPDQRRWITPSYVTVARIDGLGELRNRYVGDDENET